MVFIDLSLTPKNETLLEKESTIPRMELQPDSVVGNVDVLKSQ